MLASYVCVCVFAEAHETFTLRFLSTLLCTFFLPSFFLRQQICIMHCEIRKLRSPVKSKMCFLLLFNFFFISLCYFTLIFLPSLLFYYFSSQGLHSCCCSSPLSPHILRILRAYLFIGLIV